MPDIFCKKGIWTLVSEGITEGCLGTNKCDPVVCLVTYRRPRDPPPTNVKEGPILDIHNINIQNPRISCYEKSDIYVMAIDQDLIICVDRYK